MRIVYHVMSAPGPLGLLFLARTDRGLRYLEFLDRRSIRRAIDAHRDENAGAEWQASLLELKPIVDQLEAYFCGASTKFDVALDPVGSEFELTVWNALLEIPYGETRSYGQIAKAIGQPRATRAVGLANNHNPLAIIVPCHRVIGADGSLTGYGGGMPRKKWLLGHERHFGMLSGETLDLFAGATSAQVNRIASGEGPPLGAQRTVTAPVKVRVSARPAPRPARSSSRPVAVVAKRGGSTSTARGVAKSGARVSAKSGARVISKNGARAAVRPAPKSATKSSASKTARAAGRGPARSSRSTRRASR